MLGPVTVVLRPRRPSILSLSVRAFAPVKAHEPVAVDMSDDEVGNDYDVEAIRAAAESERPDRRLMARAALRVLEERGELESPDRD